MTGGPDTVIALVLFGGPRDFPVSSTLLINGPRSPAFERFREPGVARMRLEDRKPITAVRIDAKAALVGEGVRWG